MEINLPTIEWLKIIEGIGSWGNYFHYFIITALWKGDNLNKLVQRLQVWIFEEELSLRQAFTDNAFCLSEQSCEHKQSSCII